MNYQIKQGDNLWSIVKNNYKLTDNTDIANKVNEISKANGIKDVNKIYADDTIKLVGLDSEPEKPSDSFEKSKVKEFDEFELGTDPNATFQFAPKGENLEETGKNTLAFAQEFVKANGSDGTKISTDDLKNKGLDDESIKAIHSLQDIDGDGNIIADEYASYLTFVDSLDQNVDGNIKLGNLHSVVDASFLANDKYSSRDGHAQAKENLPEIRKKISQVHTNLYEKLNQNDFTNWYNNIQDKILSSTDMNEHNELGKSEFSIPGGDDLSNYSTKLKEFATGVHKQFDKNQDGKIDSDEIKEMKFSSIESIDIDGDGHINDGELASYFHSVDLDITNYKKTQNVTSSVDGKFSYDDLHSRSMFDINSNVGKLLRKEQQEFYNHFYKEQS